MDANQMHAVSEIQTNKVSKKLRKFKTSENWMLRFRHLNDLTSDISI